MAKFAKNTNLYSHFWQEKEEAKKELEIFVKNKGKSTGLLGGLVGGIQGVIDAISSLPSYVAGAGILFGGLWSMPAMLIAVLMYSGIKKAYVEYGELLGDEAATMAAVRKQYSKSTKGKWAVTRFFLMLSAYLLNQISAVALSALGITMPLVSLFGTPDYAIKPITWLLTACVLEFAYSQAKKSKEESSYFPSLNMFGWKYGFRIMLILTWVAALKLHGFNPISLIQAIGNTWWGYGSFFSALVIFVGPFTGYDTIFGKLHAIIKGGLHKATTVLIYEVSKTGLLMLPAILAITNPLFFTGASAQVNDAGVVVVNAIHANWEVLPTALPKLVVSILLSGTYFEGISLYIQYFAAFVSNIEIAGMLYGAVFAGFLTAPQALAITSQEALIRQRNYLNSFRIIMHIFSGICLMSASAMETSLSSYFPMFLIGVVFFKGMAWVDKDFRKLLWYEKLSTIGLGISGGLMFFQTRGVFGNFHMPLMVIAIFTGLFGLLLLVSVLDRRKILTLH